MRAIPLGVCLTLTLFACASSARRPATLGPADGRELVPTDLERVRVGEAAPEFVLADAEGKAHALTDYEGQLIVLFFYRGHW